MRAKCLQSFVLSRQARSKAWEMLLNGVGIIAVLNGGQSGGRVVQMNRKGFTLIELLIVVVIIGILAAIAIPKFANTKEKAYLASMKSDLRNLRSEERRVGKECRSRLWPDGERNTLRLAWEGTVADTRTPSGHT